MIVVDEDQPLAQTLKEARRLKKLYRAHLQKDPCAYCGYREGNGERRKKPAGTIDHIVPKSTVEHHYERSPKQHEERGWENWTGCCYNCNHSKEDLSLLMFLLKPTRPKGTPWPTQQ